MLLGYIKFFKKIEVIDRAVPNDFIVENNKE